MFAGAWKLWAMTIRVRLARPKAELLSDDTTQLFLFWHNRLFLIAELYKRLRPHRTIYGLVSGSKDGALLSEFFDRIGICPIRGSSSKRGATALKEIVKQLRAGHDVGITPDGPRGPCYTMQSGAAKAIQLAKCDITLVNYSYSRAWRLKSWDRFFIPLPFSSVHMDTLQLKFSELPEDTAELRTFLEKKLRAMSK